MNPISISHVVGQLKRMAGTPQICARPIDPTCVAGIVRDVSSICNGVGDVDPHLAQKLSEATRSLFASNPAGQAFVNPVALGKVIFALEYLAGRDMGAGASHESGSMWSLVHPAIVGSSKPLYEDGYYAEAAVAAFIEFNDRAKRLHEEARPFDGPVPDGRDLMNRLFSPKNHRPAGSGRSPRKRAGLPEGLPYVGRRRHGSSAEPEGTLKRGDADGGRGRSASCSWACWCGSSTTPSRLLLASSPSGDRVSESWGGDRGPTDLARTA